MIQMIDINHIVNWFNSDWPIWASVLGITCCVVGLIIAIKEM